MLILGLWGSNAEGQAGLFDSWVREYVEEKALAFEGSRRTSSLQLADINSFMAGSGGDSSNASPAPSLEASTIRDSALVAMTPPDNEYIDRLTARHNGISEYTVQDGDLLSFIASDYGVSISSVMWANKLKDADSISPGQILRIPPVTGVIHTAKSGDTVAGVAKKYGGDADRIIAYNRLPKDGSLEAGDEIIIPDGTMPGGAPVVSPAAYGTSSVARLVQAAKNFAHLPDLGEFFKLPTFGYNWGRIHGRNGVDIANSCGTPVYAAADGTVTVSDGTGYNGGFGKYVKIAHPNGTETLYGHGSKLLVSVGQVVGKGDKIMLMGTTGRSTGCHLHFEVHGARNPLAKS